MRRALSRFDAPRRHRSRLTTNFLALAAVALAACSEPDTPARAVVLISIDTLRPERLGVYGNTPDVSPAIDALAAESIVFDNALATAPWTLPSHMSMFTGLDPIAHGVEKPSDTLSDSFETVTEAFAARGFDTAAFTAGAFVGTGFGYEQGFDLFDACANCDQDFRQRGFSRYIERAERWIEERGERPFFLFLHTFEAHAPYDVCDPDVLARFRSRPVADDDRDHLLFRGSYTIYARQMRFDRYGRIQELLNDYDAGVHEADNGVARILDTLRRTQRFDDALVIVVSDHGESFYDHGLWVGHGLELTDDCLRVPLIVKLPGGSNAGRRVDTLVDLVDLAPTMLEAADIPAPAAMQGSSLRTVARGGPRSRDYVIGGTYTTASYFLARDELKFIGDCQIPPLHSVRQDMQPITPTCLQPYELGQAFRTVDGVGVASTSHYPNDGDPLGVFDALPVVECLFDRDADPGEQRDLALAQPKKLARMRDALRAEFLKSKKLRTSLTQGALAREWTAAELRQFHAMGYTVGVEPPPAEDIDRHLAEARSRARKPAADHAALADIDRRVHRVRLALRDHGKLDAQHAHELRACAEAIAAWAREPDLATPNLRALWRVLEIRALGAECGQPVDVSEIVHELAR